MKKTIGKISAILLAVLLLVSAMSVTAFAAVTSLPDTTSERILNIYKYNPVPEEGTNGDGTVIEGIATGKVPLQDVEFEIYKLNDTTTNTDPKEDGVTFNAVTGAVGFPNNDFAVKVATIKTNANGLATYSFGTGTDKDGIYLIVEKPNDAVVEKAAPFYVSMPLTDVEETGWLYTVTVYPKNDVPAAPTVKKDVGTIDNKTLSTDIGDAHTWILRGSVPADLYRTVLDPEQATVPDSTLDVYAKDYTLTDTLPSVLTYVGNLAVKVYDKTGVETDLKKDVDYITTGTTAEKDVAGGIVKVTLTDTGKKLVQGKMEADGEKTPEIRVYFDTYINDTATLDTIIPNNVALDYTNSANYKYAQVVLPTNDVENPLPEVHMGGIRIDKFDAGDNTKLADAKFKLARTATAEEIADAAITKETLIVGEETKTVVFVDFYTDEDITGPAVYEVTTGDDGAALLYGLGYSNNTREYYLVETQAPDGYNLLSNPIPVTIDKDSYTEDNAVEVGNSAKFILPITGGNGTMLFTMGGIVLIGLAVIVLVISGKKKHAAK